MVKRKKAASKKVSKKTARKAPKKKKGGRDPSGKGKQSKVHKLLKWLRLRK
ncbi:MAG: hypothetical protein AB1657_03195 [Candidatus Micrarchaeota archaeon]